MFSEFNHQGLRRWFFENKRDLPWRENPSPYSVWVSEVMLQQTQVSVVVPFYLHWMKKFPTIDALAEAPLTEVIKTWEGLGYYSRARRLHEGAQYLAQNYQGKFPEDPSLWGPIKGIGPYTKAALLCFAFKRRALAIDGNVERVLARHFAIEEDLSKAKGKRHLQSLIDCVLPLERPWEVSEAFIELGATICTRTPLCDRCPLNHTCQSLKAGTCALLPNKGKKTVSEKVTRVVAVIESNGHFMLRRCLQGEIMQDLHEFPFFASSAFPSIKLVEEWLDKKFGLSVLLLHALKEVKHSFTRYRVKLFPFYFTARCNPEIEGYQWVDKQSLRELPFSSGHRRIMEQVLCLN